MTSQLLLTVAESYRLTGLGVLAIGQHPAPVLQQFALHTKLEVHVHFPDGHHKMVVASVEEMSRPAKTASPNAEPATQTDAVLLLESDVVTDLPPGTEIWWSGEADLLS
ncbi:hypothetical protein [Hymenobacter radiodurans]|uniref:hypothetical protein n=1 Tax=Hymenobacter radiodurans TaxID=2496028 RepID=UPI001058E35C|nr:hypothetical protein [Hymenobacter radiodurans]